MIIEQVKSEVLEARLQEVRAFLEAENLGALVVYSPAAEHKWGQTGHVSYLTGWANHDRIVDTAVVVPVDGPPALLYAGLPFMAEQVVDVSPLEDVRMVQAVDPNAVAAAPPEGVPASEWIRDFAGETLAVLQEREIFNKDIGLVGVENMPVPFYEALSNGIGPRLRRTDDIVAELRAIKSPGELETIKHAAHLGDLGFEAMVEVARPGMRGIEIIAEMERVARREGADHAKYWMASGPPTTWNDSRLDIKPHERVLGDGDLLAVCSYIVYKGYWSHGQRTGTMGRPSESLEQMYTIARDAQDAGIAVMKPDVPAGHIARAVREKVAESGWELQGGRVGHGIGLDYSERPVPAEANQMLLQPGMTIILHSAFSLPGTGKLFVPLGDHLHVTPDGADFLMGFTRDLFLIEY